MRKERAVSYQGKGEEEILSWVRRMTMMTQSRAARIVASETETRAIRLLLMADLKGSRACDSIHCCFQLCGY